MLFIKEGIASLTLQDGIRVDVTLTLLAILVLILRLLTLLEAQLFLLDLLSRLGSEGLGAVTLLGVSLDGRCSAGNGGLASGVARSGGPASVQRGPRKGRGRRNQITRAGGRSALLQRSDLGRVGISDLESLLIDSELNRGSGSLRSQVVHARLQTELPAGKVHAGDLAHGRVLHMDVERLGLINEGTSVGGHLDDLALGNLPNGLVESLDLSRDVGDILDGTVLGNDSVLHGIRPQAHVDEILEQPGVNNLELASKDTALVDVGGVRLEALVVTQDLRSAGSGHRGKQQTVANTMLLDLLPERLPVPEVRGLHVPHVELENTLRGRRALEGRVGTLLLGQLHGSSKGSMVDGLKDLLVQLSSLRRLERHAQSKESIGKTLDTDTNGSVSHVAVASFRNGVVVHINDPVQVANDSLCDLVQLLEVVAGLVVVDERGKGKRGKVADSNLIRGTVLDNLSAQVGAADGTQVLLVALAVAVILVEHEGVTSLGLSLEDGIPELLGLHGLTTLAGLLILLVQSLELLTVAVGKTGTLVGTHEGPVTVLLNTLHEEIGNPESEEQVASADLLFAVVLAQVKELKDICVPGLKVDGKGTRSLVATLIDVSGSVVEDTKHGGDTVGGTVGTGDVGAGGTDSVHVQANTTGHLGDHGTGLESIINTLNTVLLHVDKEA